MWLWTPSPVNVAPEVWEAAQRPMCHRSSEFETVLHETQDILCSMAGMDRCAILNGNGSLAVAAAIRSFIGPDDRVFVWDTGKYAKRMWDAVSAAGCDADRAQSVTNIDHDWFLYCHQETMTGQINIPPELPEGTKVLCDMVSTFGAYEMPRADVVATCGNKCLESICGVGIVLWQQNTTEMPNAWPEHPLDVAAYISQVPCTLNVPAVLGLRRALIDYGEDRQETYNDYRVLSGKLRMALPFDVVDTCKDSVNVSCFCTAPDMHMWFRKFAKAAGHAIYPYDETLGQFRICNMGYGLDDGLDSLVEVANEVLH